MSGKTTSGNFSNNLNFLWSLHDSYNRFFRSSAHIKKGKNVARCAGDRTVKSVCNDVIQEIKRLSSSGKPIEVEKLKEILTSLREIIRWHELGENEGFVIRADSRRGIGRLHRNAIIRHLKALEGQVGNYPVIEQVSVVSFEKKLRRA
ncbi:MAG TPA: hypothetical protein VN420_01255 [Candidatus Fimivivens sp.]|nr:hypothetical protein [Candidatus Fimivivens sp.]